MPELKCTVQTCMHNLNDYCCLDQITVGGNSAKQAEDTCCDSFEKRNSSTTSNSAKDATAFCSIDCKAENCMYNDSCECHAGKISVEGGGACRCQETACATFQKQC